MRVGQLLHGAPEEAGGTGLYVGALARALVAEGHEVHLLVPGAPASVAGWTLRRDERGTTHTLRAPLPDRWSRTWSDPAQEARLRARLRELRLDVLHIHHLSGWSLGTPTLARELGLQVVLTLHDYALPCARGQLVDRDQALCAGPSAEACARCVREHLRLEPLTAVVGRVLRRWPGLRQAARDQLAMAPPRRGDQALVDARLRAVARCLEAPQVLLSPSQDLARRFESLGLRRPTWWDLPLPRAVPPAPPAPPGPLRFLFASTVIPTKGPRVLLEAFRRLPVGSATLTFAGHAPPYDGLPAWAAEVEAEVRATPGATWLGALPHSAVPELMAAHDVLVLPSLWPENSPLVVREATAAGLPVVLSSLGGAAELAPEASLVPPGDVEALHRALEDWCRRGRRRLPPRTWPTAPQHAAALVEGPYRWGGGAEVGPGSAVARGRPFR